MTSMMPLEKVIDYRVDNMGGPDQDTMKTMFPGLDVNAIREDRVDIKKYLSTLFKDPAGFMKIMLLTDSFISGSRALEFFLPGMKSRDSDWDIFCVGSNVQCMLLVDELRRQGFETIQSAGSNYAEAESLDFREAGSPFRVLHGEIWRGSNVYKVQVMNCACSSELEVVLDFHSSAVACIISGHSAVSVFSTLTSNHKSMAFEIRNAGFLRTAEVAMQKYRERGVKYVGKEDPEVSRLESSSLSLYNSGSCVLQFMDEYGGDTGLRRMCLLKSQITHSRLWTMKDGRVNVNTTLWRAMDKAFHSGAYGSLVSLRVTKELHDRGLLQKGHRGIGREAVTLAVTERNGLDDDARRWTRSSQCIHKRWKMGQLTEEFMEEGTKLLSEITGENRASVESLMISVQAMSVS